MRHQQDCLLWKSGDLGIDEVDILKLIEFANILLLRKKEKIVTQRKNVNYPRKKRKSEILKAPVEKIRSVVLT